MQDVLLTRLENYTCLDVIFILDIFKYPDNLEGLLSVTLASASVTASINDGKVMLTTSSSNSITLNACIGVTYCVSQIYAFDCIDMTISFPDTADAYKNVLYQQQIEVYNGADQININSLENLSIIGDSKPSNMKITSAGVIEWTPSSSYAGTTITITVLASATINSILYSGKFYTVTKTLDIKIDSHVLFIVNFSIIPYY